MKKLVALAAAIAAAPASAQTPPAPVETVASPDGSIQVEVTTDGDGRALYSVSRRGVAVVSRSRLGFLFTDARKIERNLKIASATRASRDETWEQPWGEWRRIRSHHNEMRVRLMETTALGRVMDVVFRVQDDGVGFRYEFPDQPNLKTANVAEELTEFNFATGGTAWWKPAFLWNREEYLYRRTPIDAVGTAATPITMKLDDGTHVSVHEASLVDYSSMALIRNEAPNSFKAQLTPGSGAPKVVKQGAWNTPWRTLIIADDAPGIYQSHLMLNLNEPNKLGDVSWIKPGKFAGVWWKMIKNEWSWARGPKHGATTANVKRYIDFAAKNGIGNVLVEGWNVGWDGDWFGNGNDMDFDRPTEDFDAKALAAYGKRKGVRLIGHHETGGAVSHYDEQLDDAFKFARDHGYMYVKTGYVADAGQLERKMPDGTTLREWHESQWTVNHHLRVLEAAAKYKVGIDTHEPVKGTGLQRTYPNWVAREGSRGMEYNAWGGKNPPEHEANLVFTRMLEGPMDFTPGVLSLTGQDDSAILSTIAKQLALYVVLYSPVQMAADTPENYARYPQALKFIRDVVTDWEDTRVLDAEVGDHVTIARKDRNSANWFLGAVTDEEARTRPVTLDFLDEGRTYTAEIYRDGEGATYATADRHKIAIEKRTVRKGERLEIPMAPGGGYAVMLRAGKR
jgi:alpha-glucosidase